MPVVFHECRDIVDGSCNGGEPIVEGAVILCCDGTGARVENEGNGGGMKGAESKVNISFCAWFEFGQRLPISNFLVQNIGWTTKDMDVVIFGVWPTLSRELVHGRQTSGGVR